MTGDTTETGHGTRVTSAADAPLESDVASVDDAGAGHDPRAGDGSPSDVVRLRALLRERRGPFALLAATSVVGGFLEALSLVLITRVALAISGDDDAVDIVIGATGIGQTMALAALLIVLAYAAQVAAAAQSAQLSASVVADFRRSLADAFLDADWSTQHDERSGRLQELLSTFVMRGAELINAIGLTTFNAFSLLALLTAAIVIDPVASVVVIVAVLVLGWALRPLRRRIRRESRGAADAGMELATSLSETSRLGLETHVFQVQPAVKRRLDGLIAETETKNRRVRFAELLVPVTYSNLAYVVLILSLGGISLLASDSLASVGTVLFIMLRSLRYGQGLQVQSSTINATRPFMDSLHRELEHFRRAAVDDGGRPIGEIGELRLEHVSFEYTPGVPVLTDIDATIAPREVVGVVGPSGSGKSTLVQLLLGLRPPTSGRIVASGRDIATFSKQEWARKVTFVPQDANLVRGSIADNIRFLRSDVSDADIERAARLANLHDDVAGFADGYDHDVGDGGSRLSGGQRQRVTIARALVERPDVLILDEPTSALDVKSEYLVRSTLDDLRHRMTVIIIAHRMSTLEICNRLMVIHHGRLAAFDTPERLRLDNDFYREVLTMSEIETTPDRQPTPDVSASIAGSGSAGSVG